MIGATAYDPGSGVAVYELPRSAPKLRVGRTRATLGASDFQEGKNINVFGSNLMPNTKFQSVRIHAVRGTTATWLVPRGRGCVRGNQAMLVLANSTGRVKAVRFFDGARQIGIDRRGASGVFSVTWRVRSARRGRHRLRAVVTSTVGRNVVASRVVRVCR